MEEEVHANALSLKHMRMNIHIHIHCMYVYTLTHTHSVRKLRPPEQLLWFLPLQLHHQSSSLCRHSPGSVVHGQSVCRGSYTSGLYRSFCHHCPGQAQCSMAIRIYTSVMYMYTYICLNTLGAFQNQICISNDSILLRIQFLSA